MRTVTILFLGTARKLPDGVRPQTITALEARAHAHYPNTPLLLVLLRTAPHHCDGHCDGAADALALLFRQLLRHVDAAPSRC